MNAANVRGTLIALGRSLRALVDILRREFPDEVRYWSGLVAECDEMQASSLTARSAQKFGEEVSRAFGVGMGAFSETMIWRDDYNERVGLNQAFQACKAEVSGLAGQLVEAALEGEFNPLALRRNLTSLESAFLETGHQVEAARVRVLLNQEELDRKAASALTVDLEMRQWSSVTSTRILPIIEALKAEFQNVEGSEEKSNS